MDRSRHSVFPHLSAQPFLGVVFLIVLTEAMGRLGWDWCIREQLFAIADRPGAALREWTGADGPEGLARAHYLLADVYTGGLRIVQIALSLFWLSHRQPHWAAGIGLGRDDTHEGTKWGLWGCFFFAVLAALLQAGALIFLNSDFFLDYLMGGRPDPAMRSGRYLATLVAVQGLIGPVAEEVFFRGILYGVLRHRRGPLVALLTTSLLFAGLHGLHPFILVVQFPGGLVFGWVYERSRSLVAPTLVHGAGNTALLAIHLLYR